MRPLSFEREEEFVRSCDGFLILEREPSAAMEQSDSGRRPGSFPRQEVRIISASRAPMSLLVQYVFYPPLGRPHPLPRPHPLHPPSHPPPPPPPRHRLTPPPTPPNPPLTPRRSQLFTRLPTSPCRPQSHHSLADWSKEQE